MTKKHVESVAKDIRSLLVGVKTGTHRVDFESPELLTKYGMGTVKALRKTLDSEAKVRPPATFYASEVGSKCPRQLWYKYHQPTNAEPLSGSASMKYLYGGVIEETVLRLAEIAGHTVAYEQEPVSYTYNGVTIRGRCDAVIDGDAVVDVKSTSSYGFKDFQRGAGGAKFGYKEQLDFYQWQLELDGKLPTYNKKGYIAVDKQLGHIEYCPDTSKVDWSPIWGKLGIIVSSPKEPPFPRLDTVTEGSNEKLGLECSYCSFRQTCWNPVANGGKGLRAFQYSGKVTWLAQVRKEPKVAELTNKLVVSDGSE